MKKSSLFTFVLLAFLISCNEDGAKEVPGPAASPGDAMNVRMGATTGEQIPDVVRELERLTGKRAGSASKGMALEDVVIDFSNIRWIIGQNTGRTNYTFPILVKGQGMDAFYNLIVMVEADGGILPPMVREYRVAPDAMEGFRASGYDFAEFRGTVGDHSFEDFFNASLDLDLLAKSPGCPPAPIGSQSENPVPNPDLIVVDQHQNWSGGGESHPMGQVSFDSDAYAGALHSALVYVNTMQDGQNHTRYQETVTTYSEGVVNVGTSAINAPVLSNFFAGPPTVTGVTVTVSGVGSLEDGNYCVTYVVETTHYSNGYVENRTIYAGVCTDSPAPDQKSGMAGRSSEDCPGGGDGSLVLVPYELVAIQDKLCLPEEGQAYAFLMENGAERHQLYTYLEDENVPDDCTVDSPARLFALEAAMAMAEGAEVDFEEQIIYSLPICLEEVIGELLNSENGKFSQIIHQFSGKNPIPQNYNWKIKAQTSNGTTDANASTSPIVQNGSFVQTKVYVDNVSEATDISMARTFVHEAFHAYLVFVYRYQNIDLGYVGLLNQFAIDYNNNANDTHHALFIKENLISEIATGLQEFGESQGYSFNSQYYNDMAWGGLTHIGNPGNPGNYILNPAFEEAVPNISDQQRILSRLEAEKLNHSVNGIQPKGSKACP